MRSLTADAFASAVTLINDIGVKKSMPFCGECKAMVYPIAGKMTCKRCGWTSKGPVKSKVVTKESTHQETVVHEVVEDMRAQQDTECPKCGHGKAYFHLMQTRRSDEPPTEINECTECHHKWREY
jgi:DNA-directed RNA polymerase subunit M